MMHQNIEVVLYELSRWFMMPVLALIILLFLYALYMLGGFVAEWLQRGFAHQGCPVLQNLIESDPAIQSEDLELGILAELEGLRLTSRAAPLLGLVATMIPMGPALAGVAVGDMATVGEQVGIAFAAVIIALLAAALTFAMHSVRRRWRLTELRQWERRQSVVLVDSKSITESENPISKELHTATIHSYK